MKREFARVFGKLIVPLALAATAPVHAEELDTLSFNEALSAILARSTTIGAQNAVLGATKARAVPARLFYLPTITGEVREFLNHYYGESSSFGQMEIVAQLNLWRFGGDVAAMRAANADVDRERANTEATRITAEAEGVRALLNLIERRAGVEILLRNVSTEEESYSIAKQRYERGLMPMQEVQKVQIDLENVRSLLADARVKAVEASTNVERLLGHIRVRTSWPWIDFLSAGPAGLRKEGALPETVDLSKRPDWRSALWNVDAEEQRTRRDWTQLFPTVDGSFVYGHYDVRGGEGWTGVLSVSVPLFDRLTRVSQARSQAYTTAAAEMNLEQIKRTARSEWEFSQKQLDTALENALSRERTLAISRGLYQDNIRRFQSGKQSANDLSDDLTRLLQSELLSLTAWSAAHLAWAQVCHAQGRLVTGDCPTQSGK